MKRSLPICLCLLAFGAPTLARAGTATLHDFTATGFDYGYEDWKDSDVMRQEKDGVRLDGTPRGGGGLFFFNLLDLSSKKGLEVKLKNNDSTSGMVLKLVGAVGSETFDLPLPEQDGSFHTIKLDFARPREKADGFNLEEVKSIQVQGNFDPAKRVDVTIATLSTVD